MSDPWQQPQYQAPGRQMSVRDEKTWATLGHVSWLVAGIVGLPFLGPLLIFLILRDRGPFIRHHAAEALNMIISTLIYEVVLILLATGITVATFGIGAAAYLLPSALGIAMLVFSILAAVAANQGRVYRYPLIFRFVS